MVSKAMETCRESRGKDKEQDKGRNQLEQRKRMKRERERGAQKGRAKHMAGINYLPFMHNKKNAL